MFTIMGSYVILSQPVFAMIESYNWFKSITLDKNGYIKYLSERTLVVILTIVITLLFPNLSLVLQLSGSVTGTLISVVLPVLFYNRAYSFPKGEFLEGASMDDEAMKLLDKELLKKHQIASVFKTQ